MSTKNNVFLIEAALILSLGSGVRLISEGILNDTETKAPQAVQVGIAGRFVLFVDVFDSEVGAEVIKAVADKSGNVRLFSNASAVMASVKKMAVSDAVPILFTKKTKAATLGDPVVALKSKYKKMKAEFLSASTSVTDIQAKISSAAALGWDVAPSGSLEALEFQDLGARLSVVEDWSAHADNLVATFAASLVSAGIDPVTVV